MQILLGTKRRGQAAVETMLLAFLVMMILMSLVHLFTVTWASENAHIRAREGVMHGTSFLVGDRADIAYTSVSSSPFDSMTENYSALCNDYSCPITPYRFTATASDTTPDGFFGSQAISVQAVIAGN
jgi:hypothetical protein